MAALAKRVDLNKALDEAWGHSLPANDEPQEGIGLVDGHELSVHQYQSGWRTKLNGTVVYEGCAEEARRIYDNLCVALGAEK
jgi:hypothetical protein